MCDLRSRFLLKMLIVNALATVMCVALKVFNWLINALSVISQIYGKVRLTGAILHYLN